MSNYKYEVKPEIKTLLQSPPYAFLKDNQHLDKNIVFLTYGGSYAYGTNIPGSDIDIRGCAHNSKEEILLGRDFEQVVNVDTDTTVYSIKKLFYLFANANPNTIEMLGCRPQDYIYMTDIGRLILDNKDIFAYCYTQLTDVEQELNGIYYYDRTEKFDAQRLYKINTKVAAIEK